MCGAPRELMFENGAHPKVVQERLGHSTIGITMDTYTHVMPNMQEEAAGHLQVSLGGSLAKAAACRREG